MSSVKQNGPAPTPAPAAKPAGGFCDECRKVHLGGLDICPKMQTNRDLSVFLDEMKATIEPRTDTKTIQTGPIVRFTDQLQGKTEKTEEAKNAETKITLADLPCDRFAV
jgi:hypothetical protein